MNYTTEQLAALAAQHAAKVHALDEAAAAAPKPIGHVMSYVEQLAAMRRKWEQRSDAEKAEDDRRYREAIAEAAARERQERERDLLGQLGSLSALATPLEREKVGNLAAVRECFRWKGTFPGLLLIGATGTGKTRAAIALLRKLCIEGNLRPRCYTLHGLMRELREYDKHGLQRSYDGPNPYKTSAHVLFIDDIDKGNQQFQSETSLLWEFYSWIYSSGKAAITTTQTPLDAWEQDMGPSFARRLKEAHRIIEF